MRGALVVMLLVACGASPPARESTNGDADADTVRGAADACPSEAEDLDGRHDDDGCPDVDDDGDGIADVDDLCPCDVEDFDAFEDADGCADLDDDHDRIVDACDLCPNEPETYDGGCDEDGCPDHGHVCVEEMRIQIVEHVYFRRSRADLQPASAPLLDAIAETMRGNPQITLLALIGQAEPTERQREGLARRRAEAVLEALVARGVPRDHLVAEAGTSAAVVGLAPERQRRVELAVRAIDGVDLPRVAEGTPLPPEPSCGSSYQACEVPVCAPMVTPPAC